jgi:hypothetical protein
MRFVEDSSSGSSSGEDDDDEPTETDLKKSKLFQAKTRDRLQKGRFFYRE